MDITQAVVEGISKEGIERPENSPILQSIFDGIPDGILVIDRSYRVIMSNKAMGTLLAKSDLEVAGKYCFYVCHETNQICHDCQATSTFANANIPSRIRICEVDGKKKQFEIWNFPIRDGNGKVHYMIEYIKDITQRQLMEKELSKARRLAILGEMAAKTSHEIRNPLNAMAGAAHYLLDEFRDDPKVQKFGGLIRDQIARLNNVTTDLLKIAKPRLSLGERALINAPLIKSIEIAEYIARDKEIEIEFFLDESLPEIRFDGNAMQEVFINILKNACDAIEEEGRIEITGQLRERKGEQFIEISVLDNGPGIPQEEQDKLFDTFFTSKEEGTGLGLPIVKDIMNSHGGYVFMESEEGQGTCVVLGLPVE